MSHATVTNKTGGNMMSVEHAVQSIIRTSRRERIPLHEALHEWDTAFDEEIRKHTNTLVDYLKACEILSRYITEVFCEIIHHAEYVPMTILIPRRIK